MGRVKEMMLEMESQNNLCFEAGQKFVCMHHFNDRYLNDYIKMNGSEGRCSYCQQEENVLDMSTLEEYIKSVVYANFSDLDSQDLPLASSYYDDDNEDISGIKRKGCYAVPANTDLHDDTSELMSDLGLCTDSEDLDSDIKGILGEKQWIKKEPFELWKNEELVWQWKKFSEVVKHSRHYTFLATDEEDYEDILSDIYALLRNSTKLFREILIGTTIYRTRSMSESVYKGIGFNDITSAPDKFASHSRMSPAGVSMFYGSFDEETAKAESIKAKDEICLIVGKFATKRDLYVLDLTSLPEDVSIWMNKWEDIAFLNTFHKDITKPITETDNKTEYIPSQIFTEYLRWMFKDYKNRTIEGMIYNSCKTDKSNIVLFCDQKESQFWLELKSYDVITHDK